MANSKSAEKRHRQSERRRERNRAARSRMRTEIKKVRLALEEGDVDKAAAALPEAIRIIDRSAQKSVVHANTAARNKSRLIQAVRSAQGAS